MTEQTKPPQDEVSGPKSKRLRRLIQCLVIVALLWGISTLVRRLLPPPPLDLARASVARGQFDVAVSEYLRHLTNKPEDWAARVELGALLMTSDRPQALSEFRKVPPDSEAYPEALRRIALVCLQSDRFTEAEEALLELEKRLPDDGSIQLLLAELYFRLERPKVALPYAEKSSRMLPEQARPHFLLAEVLDDLSRPAEMVEPLRRVLALAPEDYSAHLNLGYALATVGQAAEAKREAEWCLQRNPADVHARRFLAMALRDEGNAEEALLEVQRALELAPQDLECRLLEADLLVFNRQPEQALERLKPLYETFRNDRRLAALLARSAAAAGKTEEAELYRAHVQKLSER